MTGVTYLPLHFEHLRSLTPHISQQTEYEALLAPKGEAMVRTSFGLSAWHHGRCVGAGGVCLIWAGRAEAWAIFGEGLGPLFAPVARHIKFVLDSQPHRRLELTVKADNVEGHRLAHILGFGQPESYMRAYHPDGSDMYMYARIKPWRQ